MSVDQARKTQASEDQAGQLGQQGPITALPTTEDSRPYQVLGAALTMEPADLCNQVRGCPVALDVSRLANEQLRELFTAITYELQHQ